MTKICFDDKYFMREALKQAQQAYNSNEVPIGAVIVCEEKIIAKSYNMTEKLNDVTAHAEILAITSAAQFLGSKYLTNCDLYVTIEPCPMCAGAAKWAQIKKIVFGAGDEKCGYNKFSSKIIPGKTKVVSGILEDECEKLMKDFFRTKR